MSCRRSSQPTVITVWEEPPLFAESAIFSNRVLDPSRTVLLSCGHVVLWLSELCGSAGWKRPTLNSTVLQSVHVCDMTTVLVNQGDAPEMLDGSQHLCYLCYLTWDENRKM